MVHKLLMTMIPLLAMLNWNCKSKEKIAASDTTMTQAIHFGNGGGFTGKVEAYTLLPTGQLYKKGSAPGSYKVDEKLCQQFFNNFELLGFNKMVIDSPGNMYYFVSCNDGEKEHKLTWGAYDSKEPQELTIYYNSLFQLAQRMKKSVKSENLSKK